MFISVLEIFKIGIGPSSSHTMGPMLAANQFLVKAKSFLEQNRTPINEQQLHITCTLKGSLSFTGKGHATDRAVVLGLNGYTAKGLANLDIDSLMQSLWCKANVSLEHWNIHFTPEKDIIFDQGDALPQHPNGLIFDLNIGGKKALSETYFSIGGGFINTLEEIDNIVAPLKFKQTSTCPYPFDSAKSMLRMSRDSQLSIAEMKLQNEQDYYRETELHAGVDAIWQAMKTCVEAGLQAEGILPGGLKVSRRAKNIYQKLSSSPSLVNVNDWLCAYAIAVNEENAAGHMVVTAPTNGAAGVIPAVLYYFVNHENGTQQQVRDFLLVASAIGGLIKHRSSISGAEVGCQGEVGSAAAMAAAGLCAVRGGTTLEIENAAEIALEHHLGMTCDPVKGLVQIPCIERNAFGAIKAYAAASLALLGDGSHFMPLDSCIAAMKQTGLEMSNKYKETSLGGLAVTLTEC
ncbi:L-serine dehydratase TdcG [Thalassocella blandensis]|nr:L-serine dehydratase TdcG [Thalassocella blandensis]